MYKANENRYNEMEYRRCGSSGLKVSAISIGMWQNFGEKSDYKTTEGIITTAFDNGINSFDTANNYGPPNGSAEERFGEILKKTLLPYRDEIIISTKAGYPMWPGPLGEGGSKKHLMASLDQSLKRLKVDYVDIFYHHRSDRETSLEETAEALSQIVRSGRALYVALSNYGSEIFKMQRILEEDYKIHPIINQVSYSLLNKRGDPDGTLFPELKKEGIGIFAFSPLSQGRLTDKYLNGAIPPDSRARQSSFLSPQDITEDLIKALNDLNNMASMRGQDLISFALNWDLERPGMTSVILGARNQEQLKDSLKYRKTYAPFSDEEENMIKNIVKGISFRR